MKRTMTLKKESLSELTTSELGDVAGATGLSCTCALLTVTLCAFVVSVVEGCIG